MRSPRNLPPPADFDVPPVPLSMIIKYRHRKHLKGMVLGFGIGVLMIIAAGGTHNPVVAVFGFGFIVVTWELSSRACKRSGCKRFKGR